MVPKHWKYIVIVVSLFVTIFTLSAFPKQDEGSVPTTVTPIPTLAPDPTNSSDLQSLQNIYPTPTSKLGEPIPVPTVIVGEAQVLVKAPTILTTIKQDSQIFSSDTGDKIRLVGHYVSPKSDIISVSFIPTFYPNNGKVDATPYVTFHGADSSYHQTSRSGWFDILMETPVAIPGIYYIEATIKQLGSESISTAGTYFEVKKAQGIPSPTLFPGQSMQNISDLLKTTPPIDTSTSIIPSATPYPGLTPFPSIPGPGTPIPAPVVSGVQPHIESTITEAKPGTRILIKGGGFPFRGDITSLWFIPIYPESAQKTDITPYREWYDSTTNRVNKSYLQTHRGGILEYIIVPRVQPGLYYIELTASNIPGSCCDVNMSKSGAMLFRVTGDPKPTPTIPLSPTAIPTSIPTMIPTIIPINVSINNYDTRPGNTYTLQSTARDIYYGPNQICSEDL